MDAFPQCRLSRRARLLGTLLCGVMAVSGCSAAPSSGAVSDTMFRKQLAELAAAPDGKPDGTEAIIRSATALADTGHDKEALELAEPAYVLHETDPALAHLLGRLQLKMKDAAAADATYRGLLARQPDDMEALNGSGIAAVMLGRLPAAEAAFRQATVLAPANLDAQSNLALVLAMRGDAATAIAMLERLHKADAQSPGIRHNLALAYAVAGRRDAALALLVPDMATAEAEKMVTAYARLAATAPHGSGGEMAGAAPGPAMPPNPVAN